MVVEIAKGKCTIVRASGEMDLSNVGELESALDTAREGSPRGFVVDLSGAAYLDGTTVQAVLQAWQCMRGEGMLIVVTGDLSRELFRAVGLDKLPSLALYDSISDATDALSCAREDA